MSQVQGIMDQIKTDADGFLLDKSEWNEHVALGLAQRAGLSPEEMTTESMDLLHSLRDYYRQFHSFPAFGYICKGANQERDCLTVEFLDPITAWKVAGLPRPAEEVFAHLRH